jgi:SAM-dependent methyltransferase
MVATDLEQRFTPVAHALRDAIIDHYHERRQPLHGEPALRTLDTNSLLAGSRGRLLLEVLFKAGVNTELESTRVADLGCGFGALSLYFAVAGAEVIGIDPNADRFGVGAAVAREFELPVSFARGWLEDLVLPDESIDLAVLNNSLCYVVNRRDRRRTIVHVRRVLVPGGAAVLRNPSRSSLLDPFTGLPLVHQLPPRLAQALLSNREPPRSPVRLRTAGGMRRELGRGGLANATHVRTDPWWRPPRYQHHVARR